MQGIEDDRNVTFPPFLTSRPGRLPSTYRPDSFPHSFLHHLFLNSEEEGLGGVVQLRSSSWIPLKCLQFTAHDLQMTFKILARLNWALCANATNSTTRASRTVQYSAFFCHAHRRLGVVMAGEKPPSAHSPREVSQRIHTASWVPCGAHRGLHGARVDGAGRRRRPLGRGGGEEVHIYSPVFITAAAPSKTRLSGVRRACPSGRPPSDTQQRFVALSPWESPINKFCNGTIISHSL